MGFLTNTVNICDYDAFHDVVVCFPNCISVYYRFILLDHLFLVTRLVSYAIKSKHIPKKVSHRVKLCRTDGI